MITLNKNLPESFLVVFLFSFLYSSAQKANTTSDDTTLQKAINYTNDYKLDSAIVLYEQLLKSKPDDIDYLKSLESLYFKTSQYEKSLVLINQILSHLPNNRQYFIKKGILLNKMDDDLEAISIFKEALQSDNKNTFLLTQVADIYREINNVDSAYYYYSVALNISPNTSSIIKGVDILLKNNWNTGALSFLKKYYKREANKNKVLDHFLGRTLYLNDSILDAVILLTDVYKKGDTSKVVCKYLGLSCWKATYFSKGIYALENYTKQDTTDFLAYYALGNCYKNVRMYDKAIESFNKSMALYKRNAENEKSLLSGLIDVHRKKGNYQTSINYLKEYYQHDTTNYYAYYKIADIYEINLKDKNKAIETINQVMAKAKAYKHPQEAAPILRYCEKRIEYIKSNKAEQEFWKGKPMPQKK